MHSALDVGSGSNDKYTDIGIDGSWQFLGARRDVFTVNAALMHEKQTLSGTFDAGDADGKGQTLNSFNVNASYYRNQTWGGSLGFFTTTGSRDATLHGDSATGKPNTTGEILQVDYTPFGKEGSWMAPNANLRVGLQYTLYSRYDGSSHGASGNNTLMGLVWLAF
jgi:hypothetical protein